MIKLFRRKKIPAPPVWQDQFLQHVIGQCKRKQEQLANRLQRQSEKLSPLLKKVITIGFAIGAFSYSLYTIINAFK